MKEGKRSGQAVFFDLDGTLLDGSRYQESIVGTCEKICASQPGLEVAQVVEANTKAWQDYWPEIEQRWVLGSIDDASVRREAWRRTLAACGCDDETTLTLALQTHRLLEREVHRLFDDVEDLLTSLRRGGVPLALITNGGSETQREKIRALDIDHWFEAVVISGEVGRAKPDASIFNLALDKLGAERENTWHVGDSVPFDVGGAKAAGLKAVWLNRGGLVSSDGDPEPDFEIRSLSELPSLLTE